MKAILQFGRLGSTRLPRKLLRNVGGKSLAEIGFDYIRFLAQTTGIHPYFACPSVDTELIDLANQYSITPLLMNEEESKADIWTNLIKPFLPILSNYTHVWDANILCHPFLRKQTGLYIIENMRYDFPICFVVPERNVLYNDDLKQINSFGQLANTQKNSLYYKPSHIGYVYDTKSLALSEEKLSVKVVPFEISVTKLEQIDIDTQEDLELANLIWLGMNI